MLCVKTPVSSSFAGLRPGKESDVSGADIKIEHFSTLANSASHFERVIDSVNLYSWSHRETCGHISNKWICCV